ncbi:hypothetical protein HK18_00015 [Commensalibacter intestini]|uniref:Uncharacterized protein n=1 Tax=Commensalibacter intestini TaxID=479936 RepID=A0A251ZTJ5_9PROT|nr:hypothetical protein [Commensalibacter intestini]OUI77990.1 hypothetical protein HK18_00015 [Commensalibacter intestini]
MKFQTDAIFEKEIEIDNGKTETKKIVVQANTVDWETDTFDGDRSMGPELVHTGTTTVNVKSEEHTLIWTVYEYPEGVKNLQELDSDGLTVIKDINWLID